MDGANVDLLYNGRYTVHMAQKKTILIIEDDPVLLWVLVKKFKKEPYNVLPAEDGEAGLATALKEHPDFILLDIILPKLDGITVLKKLRVHQWGKSVPIIVLTNLSEVVTEKQIEDKDVRDYLVKTEWDIDDVVKKVNSLIGQ